MDTRLYDPASEGAALPTASRPAALPGSLARSVLWSAAALGITADALFHDGPPALGFGLWITLVALDAVVLLWRADRSVPTETRLWLGAAILFAFGLALRNADQLLAFDLLAAVGCLGLAAVAARDNEAAIFARRLRDTFFTAIDVIGGIAVGFLMLVFREGLASDDKQRVMGRLQRLARPVVIGGVALLVFGSLLRGADPIFASIVAIPAFDVETVASHVVLAGFFTWVVAGWARAGLLAGARQHRAEAALPIQLDSADITAALGTLIVLFGAFIVAQLGWFFGGEAFLRERTGLTAAAYARQGFFQMVLVVALVVPVLVGTRAALRPGHALARRHTLLSLPILVLLGAIIVSAMLRMKMYTHYYGLTTERFYPLVFMLWLGVVLVWLGLTVLRDWGRPFFAGAAISGLATLLTLNVIDPDAIVARVNVARSATPSSGAQPRLDLIHLATLRGGGVEVAVRAVLAAAEPVVGGIDEPGSAAQRCTASRMLLERWGPTSQLAVRRQKDSAWRYWNRDDALAARTVSKNVRAIREVEHASCAAARAQGTIDSSRT